MFHLKAIQFYIEPKHQQWVATAYTNGEVRLYDSSFNGQLSQSIGYRTCQVCVDAVMEGNSPTTVLVVPVQQQQVGYQHIYDVVTIA